jgi:triosephosphate isomerase
MAATSQSCKRKPFIGGNWKCNGTKKTLEELIEKFNKAALDPRAVDVVIAPAAIHVDLVQRALKKEFAVSAQNCSQFANGAFTGEISAAMLKDFGVPWVIIGHSERRKLFGDTDSVVGAKVKIAQETGLHVIACLGETEDERKDNKTMEVVLRQLKAIVDNISDWSRVVIAYEPVWAIGTKLTATPAQAEEVHAELRASLAKLCKQGVAENTRIIYGGSVAPNNCDALLAEKNIDGFLVGGASLKEDFLSIIAAPLRVKKTAVASL